MRGSDILRMDTDHDPSFTYDLGMNIKARREELGLTQGELAAKAHLSLPFLAAIEIGKKTPSLNSLDLIARAMEVEAFELLMPSWIEHPYPVRVTIRKYTEEAEKRIRTAVNKALRDLSKKYAQRH